MRLRFKFVPAHLAVPLVLQTTLLSLVAQSAAEGPWLFAVTYWEQQLITIDTSTGAGTVLTNLSMAPRDLAAHDGSLYVYGPANQSVKLSQIDPWTGATVRAVAFTERISGGEGGLDFRADGFAFATAVFSTTGTLARLEFNTTNATLITAEGGQSPSLDGLAFDTNDVLYGLSQNRGGAFGLYIVNQFTGETTLVGDLGVDFPFNNGAVAGLAFAPNGDLYAALGNPSESRLYRLNKSNGAATLVGPVGRAGVSGIRFFNPPPGPLAIGRLGANLRVSWPHARGGILETASRATGPWSNAIWPVITNDTSAGVLAPATNAEGYFRLRR